MPPPTGPTAGRNPNFADFQSPDPRTSDPTVAYFRLANISPLSPLQLCVPCLQQANSCLQRSCRRAEHTKRPSRTPNTRARQFPTSADVSLVSGVVGCVLQWSQTQQNLDFGVKPQNVAQNVKIKHFLYVVRCTNS